MQKRRDIRVRPAPRALRIGYLSGGLRVTTDPRSISTGPRAHVVGMIGGMRAAGATVVPFIAGDRAPRVLHDGASGDRMGGGRYTVDVARLALNPVLGRAARRAVSGADVLYERQATFQTLGAYRPRGSTWVVESNGPFWHEAAQDRGTLRLVAAARRLELLAYRRADLVTAVSPRLKEIIVAEAGIDPDRVLVLPNAVDTDRFPPAAASPRPGPLTIGFVGHVIDWAGLDTLVTALARLRTDGPAVRALIVGDGPACAGLTDRVRRLGLADSVEFAGLQPWTEIPGLLACCDLAYSGQVPMAARGMYHSPLKLYEYQAASLPVLASDHPDARRLLAGSDAGWLFPAGDVPALIAAIRTAAACRARLPEMGARGRAEVLRRHTWQARADELLDLLAGRGLIDDRCRAPAVPVRAAATGIPA